VLGLHVIVSTDGPRLAWSVKLALAMPQLLLSSQAMAFHTHVPLPTPMFVNERVPLPVVVLAWIAFQTLLFQLPYSVTFLTMMGFSPSVALTMKFGVLLSVETSGGDTRMTTGSVVDEEDELELLLAALELVFTDWPLGLEQYELLLLELLLLLLVVCPLGLER